MELEEAYLKLKVTDEEKKAIGRYLTTDHTQMNILADLNPALYESLRGWAFFSEPEYVKELIEDFASIYSAMCKTSENEMEERLIRGTSKTVVENLGKEFNQLISTSTDENIAKPFAEYRNGALIRFSLRKGVPYLNAEDYRGENRASEKEIILAPFCKINYKERVSEFGSYTYYGVGIGAPELPSVPQEELDKLMNEVTQGFAKNIEDMKEYSYLNEKIEGLNRYYENAIDKEDKKYISKEKSNIFQQIEEKQEKVYDFRKKLQTLLKGLCKQKELEVDKAKAVIQEEKDRIAAEERDRKRDERFSEVVSKIEQNPKYSHSLENHMTESYQAIIENENFFVSLANRLGVSYTKKTSRSSISKRIENIQDIIEQAKKTLDETQINKNDSLEKVIEISKKVEPIADSINFSAEMAEDLSKIVDLHVTQSDAEIKKNLYSKVQKTIQNAKIQKYMQEKEDLKDEKIGIFGAINGKRDLKVERLKNLDLKIQLAQATKPEKREKYSIRDMLSDMYVCAITEFDGDFTPEMRNLYETIQENYPTIKGKKFLDKDMEELAKEKIEVKEQSLPVVYSNNRFRIFGKRKSQIEVLQQKNMMLKSQITEEYEKNNQNLFISRGEKDAIEVFESKLNSIETVTADPLSRVTNIDFLEERYATMELW